MKKDNPLSSLVLPSEEDLEKLAKKRRKDLKNNINCMSNWYPLIKDLDINIPKTKLIHFPLEEYEQDCFNLFDGGNLSSKLKKFENKLIEEASNFGTPLFMKSGTFSSKHDWENTCFVKDNNKIFSQWLNIIYNSLMMGASSSHYIVLREFIDTKKELYAFNNLPITKERRYFFEKDKVTKHHPYWPPKSLENQNTNLTDWKDLLDKINKESLSEILLLKEKSLLVGKKLSKLHDNWSIDWLEDKNGNWWLIDVAVMEKSFIWADYKNLTLGLD